jgi:hypothetical protein
MKYIITMKTGKEHKINAGDYFELLHAIKTKELLSFTEHLILRSKEIESVEVDI